MQAKTVIVIAGPTAVGKTALALQLAQHFHTQIISADSRQCYREMSIGTAKPSKEELALVPHFFINSHSIHDTVNAGIFETYALEKCKEIFQNNHIAIVVGGTGLYIKAFLEGMDEMPEIPEAIREELVNQYQQKGLVWLQESIQKLDPEFWQIAEQQNPQRLLRALEIKTVTGKSIVQFRQQKTNQRSFNIIQIGLELPRTELVQNINKRVDNMIANGLLDEVAQLIPFQHINALQTVGYQELFSYFKNESTLNFAIERIKVNTRQYAKRQMTWFKRQSNCTWFTYHPNITEQVLHYLKQFGL
ncbi:MAG: tRNA (adenosine(37)-N6)-dimethylallyltransferase MiaA [Chitinophagaceae bacterium]